MSRQERQGNAIAKCDLWRTWRFFILAALIGESGAPQPDPVGSA